MRATVICRLGLIVLVGMCDLAVAAIGSEDITDGNTAFALQLYKQLRTHEIETPANALLSPYSISSVLAMTHCGAEGNTAHEMLETLNLPIDRDSAGRAFQSLTTDINTLADRDLCDLTIANALWGQADCGFLSSFTSRIENYYGGHFQRLDFATQSEYARQEINAWVSRRTNDKIPDLLSPGTIHPLTRLVLTNAIYFRANWQTQFEEDDTSDEPFALLDGSYLSVPTMTLEGRYRYLRDDRVQVLELPYEESELAMLICLPHENAGLPDLELALTPEQISDWVASLVQRKVKVYLPRFTIHDEFSLVEPLARMGIHDAFRSGIADFSSMNGRRDLYISHICHKSFIEVTESGTEAAAATAAVVATWGGGGETIPVFRADHPFFFVIRHRPTGSILFMGRLANPEGELLPDHIPSKKPDTIRRGGFKGLYK